MNSWQRISTYTAEDCYGRFWHAGLNNAGSLLFVASIDDEYAVWDIATSDRIWSSADSDELPSLSNLLVDGFVDLQQPSVSDRFRVFGPEFNHFLRYYCRDHIDRDSLAGDIIVDTYIANDTDRQRLDFAGDANEWIHASFSGDGSIIAVMNPEYLSLFHRSSDGPVAQHGFYA